MAVFKVDTASDDEVKAMLRSWLSEPYESKKAIVIKGGTFKERPFIQGTAPVADGWSTTGGLLYPTLTTAYGRFSRLLLEVCQDRQFLALHSHEDFDPFDWFCRIAKETRDPSLIDFVNAAYRNKYDFNTPGLVTVSQRSDIHILPVFKEAKATKFVFASEKDARAFDPTLSLLWVDLDK